MAKAQILIVEDDRMVAEDIQNSLISNNYNVLGIASSGEKALALLKEKTTDIVLMDIKLPGEMNGIATATNIRAEYNIPIIYLTAYSDEKILESAKSTDPFGYILKPFDERELIIAIEMALYKYKLNAELRESEQRFKDFASIDTDYFWELDADLRYSYVSDHYERYSGKNPKQLLGKTRREMFVGYIPEEKQNWLNFLDTLDAGKDFRNFIYTYIRPDGKKRILINHGKALYDANGKFAGYRGVGSDITSQRRAQEQLVEKTTLLENILRSAGDTAIATADLDLRITYFNSTAEKFFGYAAEDVIGKTVMDFHVLRNVEDERFKKAIESIRNIGEHSFVIQRENEGKSRILEMRIVAIYTSEGTTVGYSLFSQDITERKQAEKVMLKASRMEATATLAAGVAHDFNNLMVGVLGNVDLIKMQNTASLETEEMLDSIAKCARQAGELSQQLLSFARGGKYQPRAINLNELLQQAFKRDKHIFPPRIRVEHSYFSNLWNINADMTQMHQVVMNLCINAVEAIQNNGLIKISTFNTEINEEMAQANPGMRQGRHVCLRVEDSGQGMDHNTVVKIFEPFYSTKFQGRGLGLAAAYGIIKNHDGYISVESEISKGTVFTIYLPATETGIERGQSQETNFAQGSETIMVIDDEEFVRDISERVLKRFGYTVLLADNGKEAIKMASDGAHQIDLAILDMGMPTMGGMETFPKLRQAQPGMKVIICSGYELDEATRSLLDTGAVSFLQKPYSAKKLAAYVRQALDN